MEAIRLIMPSKIPCFVGIFAAVDMSTEREIGRSCSGGQLFIPTDEPIDIGIACVRLGYPAVRLRFVAFPGRTYKLFWLSHHIGANISVEDISPSPQMP